MRNASLAAWMARSQYSWCSPVVGVSLLKLHSNKNWSFLTRFWAKGKLELDFLEQLLLVRQYKSACSRVNTKMHQYIHCVWVTWRSWAMSPEIHRVVWEEALLLWKYALWIGRSFDKIIPMTKLSQPITSCDTANSWIMWGKLSVTKYSKHVIEPLPLRYRRSRGGRLGWVLFLFSHTSTPCTDCLKAKVRPALWHCATCLHNSLHSRQLGHNRASIILMGKEFHSAHNSENVLCSPDVEEPW